VTNGGHACNAETWPCCCRCCCTGCTCYCRCCAINRTLLDAAQRRGSCTESGSLCGSIG
jgi:hypothetical protein